ncbi:hypothetical protein ACJMK2_019252 [Sinanodonta woodiana]|uniref:Uncharacterized protein n=1 Tax=Sinanodonta woodiana TaxID=1069815 RepID=A0ABD3UIM5_SINWO
MKDPREYHPVATHDMSSHNNGDESFKTSHAFGAYCNLIPLILTPTQGEALSVRYDIHVETNCNFVSWNSETRSIPERLITSIFSKVFRTRRAAIYHIVAQVARALKS